MEVYRIPSKESQDILLASVVCSEVIEGLNRYFASEPRNNYISIWPTVNKRDFVLYEPEAWADILIEWLRTEHEIFYYPGMEAKYAKMERIPPFTERMMDEGALNSLKALYKRVIGQAVGINSHTLIADSIKCAVNAKESAIEKMKERIAELESNFKAVCDEDDIFRTRALKAEEEAKKLKEQLEKATTDYQALSEENQKLKNAEKSDTNKLIREYCTEHGIVAPSRYLSDEACIEYLFSVSVTILQDIYRDIFKRQPDGLSAEDIANKILNRVLETEDLLHKSVDSVNKECKAVGKQMIADYEKDLLQFIYKEYKDQIHRDEGVIAYNPPSVRNTILKIITDYARNRKRVDILETGIKSIFDKYKTKFTVDDYVINGDPTTSFMLDCISSWIGSPAFESRGKIRAEIENYKLKLKDYILKDIKEHGYRYNGLETKSIEEIVDRIIQIATCPRNEWTNREIENLRSQITRLKDLINAMNEEVKDM